MSILPYLLPLAFITLALCVAFIARARARAWADRILYGHRPGTVKQINRCIAILNWINNWITIGTDQDKDLILRLRAMLDEMQNPHG